MDVMKMKIEKGSLELLYAKKNPLFQRILFFSWNGGTHGYLLNFYTALQNPNHIQPQKY